MTHKLTLGAVAYDPKVVTIWEGFRAWFADRDFDFDFVLYSNYEAQVRAHFAGHFDVAWNSPLAWIQSERVAARTGRQARAIAMRDTDQDLTSLIITRADAGIDDIAGLRGKSVGVGAMDSPQATLIPLHHLAEAGLTPETDCRVRRFDRLVGKHGDHIGGERDAARALMAGEVDAACLIAGNHLLFASEGVFSATATRVLAETAPYDHCCFTVLDSTDEGPGERPGERTSASVDRFVELLLSQSYDDPEVRPLLDLEGLKQWRPGRTTGFAQLDAACTRSGYIDEFVAEFG